MTPTDSEESSSKLCATGVPKDKIRMPFGITKIKAFKMDFASNDSKGN